MSAAGQLSSPERIPAGACRRRVASQLSRPATSALLVSALALSSLLLVQVQSAQRVAVFESEHELRAQVRQATQGLRQLKRNLVANFENTYERTKADPLLGLQVAQRGEPAAVGLLLVQEQFGETLVKQHIIERRMLTGLRFLFARLLPLATIRRLLERQPSFAWLDGQSQIDVRPMFPGATEAQLKGLYSLAEVRARLRAADDLVSASSDNLVRILNTVQAVLIERKFGDKVKPDQLRAFAELAAPIVNYYLSDVLERHERLQAVYELQLANAADLIPLSKAADSAQFVRLLDRLIDNEALDVDLSAEASELERPPTINDLMIANVEKKWIPKTARQHLVEDQKVLLRFRALIKPLLDVSRNDEQLAQRCKAISLYLAEPHGHF